MSPTDYDAQLAENKRRYEAGEIAKDLYQKNARRIRRYRREQNRRDDPDYTPRRTTGSKTRKTRKAKQKALIAIPVEELQTEFERTFLQRGMEKRDLQVDDSFHAITFPSLMRAKMAEPEIDIGQRLLEKFKTKWMSDAKWWGIYMQGEVQVLAIGPVIAEKGAVDE